MHRRLITTNHRRKPGIPDIWCHGFTRFLGRQLSPAEKTVISALERHRRDRPRPIVIIDRPGHDTATLLDSYLQYRLATAPPGATAIRCTPSRQTGETHTPRIRHITYRQIKNIRGSTPAFMLLLNAHRAKTFSPLHKAPGNFRKACSTLFPILDRSGFLIIHLQAESLPANLPTGLLIRNSGAHPKGHRIHSIDSTDTPLVTVITLAPVIRSSSRAPVSRPATAARNHQPPPPSRYAVLRSPKLNRTASDL